MNETVPAEAVETMVETVVETLETLETAVTTAASTDPTIVDFELYVRLANIETLLQALVGMMFVLLLICLLRYVYRFFDIFF